MIDPTFDPLKMLEDLQSAHLALAKSHMETLDHVAKLTEAHLLLTQAMERLQKRQDILGDYIGLVKQV